MINIKNLIPGKPTHPGEILLDELEARGLKQQAFARQIGMQKSQLNEIIKGKRNINAELAILLEKALEIGAVYWLDAQQSYDLDQARQQERIQVRATALEFWKSVKNYVDVKYLMKQKFISGDPVKDIPVINQIYGVSTLDGLAKQSVIANRFRKSTKAQTDPLNLQTWVALVKYKAKNQHVPPFNHQSKIEVVESIRSIITKNENVMDNIRKELNQRGIKFIHQEKADRTPVDGMSCWSEGRPAIAVTLRHQRLDNLAFTLFHELGHVYLHLTNDNEACFVDLNIEKPGDGQEEKEADKFAQESLIKQDDWKRFEQAAELYTPDYIIRFSKEIGIHPAVLAGRSSYETGYYNWPKGDIDYAIN